MKVKVFMCKYTPVKVKVFTLQEPTCESWQELAPAPNSLLHQVASCAPDHHCGNDDDVTVADDDDDGNDIANDDDYDNDEDRSDDRWWQ